MATNNASRPTAAPKATAAAPSNTLKPAGEAGIGDRTLCVVSKEEFVVTADSPRVVHAGKTYYFCCTGCDTDFAKDPERYLSAPKK